MFRLLRRIFVSVGFAPERFEFLRELKRFLLTGPELFPYKTFPVEHRPLKQLIRSGDIVLDVGANIGDYAILFAKWGAEVHAFEPTRQFEILQTRTAGKGIHCYNFALGRTKGKFVVYESGRQSSSDKSWSASFGNAIPLECRITRLDDLDFTRVDFIKIDTDGMDFDVLRGSERLLQRFKPMVFCEINEMALSLRGLTGQSLIRWMTNQGYTWEILSHDVRHYDVLFRFDPDTSHQPPRGRRSRQRTVRRARQQRRKGLPP